MQVPQQKEIFDRVEDAVASIKTTSVEGYIAGGGATLCHISGKMNSVLGGEEQIGYDLVRGIFEVFFNTFALKILSGLRLKSVFSSSCLDIFPKSIFFVICNQIFIF